MKKVVKLGGVGINLGEGKALGYQGWYVLGGAARSLCGAVEGPVLSTAEGNMQGWKAITHLPCLGYQVLPGYAALFIRKKRSSPFTSYP